jgi:hypothetical protein
MLDELKAKQAAGGRREIARLTALVAGCMVLAGLFVTTSRCKDTRTAVEVEPEVPVAPVEPPVEVDRARVAAIGDTTAAHSDASYERGALDYLLSIADRPLAGEPEAVSAEALASLPFADAAGRVFEARGKVVDVEEKQFRREQQRLWSLVLEGTDGRRFVALKRGYASDPGEGEPRDVRRDGRTGTFEPIRVGESVLVRGIYLQRRTGTIGTTLVPDPIPVLVATAFRHSEAPLPPVPDLAQIEWSDIEDRFMADTTNWAEPALAQAVQWARTRGHDAIAKDLASGALPWKAWDEETFDTWEKEIGVRDRTTPRPFTDGARGKVWRFPGLLGQFLHEGWETVFPNLYGVDAIWRVDVLSEDYTYYNQSMAVLGISPFGPSAFPEGTTKPNDQVLAYGVFVKNWTYETRRAHKDGTGNAPVTVPMFVLLHLEPVTVDPKPYGSFMLVLAGSIVLFGFLFWFVLVRGERKESQRTEEQRAAMRKRMRDLGQGRVVPPTTPTPRDEGES